MKTGLIISLHFFPVAFPHALTLCPNSTEAAPGQRFIYLSWIQRPTHSPTLTLGWMNSFSTAKTQAARHDFHRPLFSNSGNLSLYSLCLFFLYRKKTTLLLFKITLRIQILTFIRHTPNSAPLSSSWHCFFICEKWKSYLPPRTVGCGCPLCSLFCPPLPNSRHVSSQTIERWLPQAPYSLTL